MTHHLANTHKVKISTLKTTMGGKKAQIPKQVSYFEVLIVYLCNKLFKVYTFY